MDITGRIDRRVVRLRGGKISGLKIVRRKYACVDIADITTVGREAVTNRRTDHEGTDHRADKLQDEKHFKADIMEG